MDSFEHKIDEVFDVDFASELNRNVIGEGKIIDKIKEVAAKGWEMLPGKLQKIGKGLLSAAKKGKDAAVEFVLSLDEETQDKIVAAMKSFLEDKNLATQVDQVATEDIEKDGVIEEAGEAEALQAARDVAAQQISSGAALGEDIAYWALVVIGLVAAAVGVKTVHVIYKAITETRKAAARGAFGGGRRRGRR